MLAVPAIFSHATVPLFPSAPAAKTLPKLRLARRHSEWQMDAAAPEGYRRIPPAKWIGFNWYRFKVSVCTAQPFAPGAMPHASQPPRYPLSPPM
jgi:hypothetical protein